jgi:hypothetical protein
LNNPIRKDTELVKPVHLIKLKKVKIKKKIKNYFNIFFKIKNILKNYSAPLRDQTITVDLSIAPTLTTMEAGRPLQ